YGNVIAYQLIENTYKSLLHLGLCPTGATGPPIAGPGFYADIPNAYGGSGFWAGTDSPTPTLDFIVQQGTSLGQAVQNVASAGNDVQGTSQCIDILFEPIYDPENRPGFTSQISVYN